MRLNKTLILLHAVAVPVMATQIQGFDKNSPVEMDQIQSKLITLERTIQTAKSNDLDVSSEEVTAFTAQNFLTWIPYDLAHTNELANQIGQWWVIKNRAPELAAAIPRQEMTDTLTILNRALADLRNVEKNPSSSRRASPNLQILKPKLRDDYWFAGNCPVFLSSFIWMPDEPEYTKNFGRLPSLYLTLRSLNEKNEIQTTALKHIRQKVAEYGHDGIRFDIFLDQSLPSWAIEKFPQITDGSRQFIGYDIDNPEVRNLWQQYFAQVIPVIHQSADGLATYMLANEPHWFTTQGVWSTGSVSEFTFQKFRKWLAARYHNDIAALNRRWNKKFLSFDAVQMNLPLSKNLKGSALWYDWCRFNMDRVNDWFAFLETEIKRYDPQAHCHIKLISDFCFSTEFEKDNGLDYETLTSKIEDVSGADTAAEAPGDDAFRVGKNPEWKKRYAMGWQVQSMYYDFLKSLAPTHLIFDSEYHALSAGNWRAPFVGPDYVRAVLWLAHLHGLGENLAWYWPRQKNGGIVGDGGDFFGSPGMQPLVMDAYGRAMKELNAFAPEIVALARAPRPIRLFYSTDSAIQSSTFMPATWKTYEAAYFLGVPIGFATEKMLTADSAAQMKDFPLLIVPSATHVSDDAMVQLKRYVKNGGTIMLFGDNCLAFNEYGEKRNSDALKFLKNAPRINADESVESIANELNSLATKAKIQRPISCRDENGNIPWGIRYVSVKENSTRLIYLLNVGKNSQTVSLFGNGKLMGETQDLLTNEKINAASLKLAPFEMRLLFFRESRG